MRVPAGWYPDPLGLPQLRWWDNQAWTEHTSEARQPMVAQETVVQQTRLSWADDEPPLEKSAPDGASGVPASHAPAAETLLQLEAPSHGALVSTDAGPASRGPEDKFAEFVQTEAPDPIAGRFDDLLVDDRWAAPSAADDVPVRAEDAEPVRFDFSARVADLGLGTGSAAAATPVASAGIPSAATAAPVTTAAPAAAMPAQAAHPDAPANDAGIASALPRTRRTSTAQAWVIASSPLTFVVVSLFLLTIGGTDVSGSMVVGLSLALPYLGCIPLAWADWYISRRRGLQPPHWLWIMASPLVYLVVRAIVLTRRTGRGFGPLLGILGSVIAVFAALILVPGIVIGVNPMGFSRAIEQSVTQQAAAFGVQLSVTCPPNPPTIVGSQFTCMAYEKGDKINGRDVRVSLQRANGWISWRVDDWGQLSASNSSMRSNG